jgi:tetratricopeptide (TPR) repeat protein
VALVAATLAAYHPAWHGGLVWDDEGHITPARLQPVAGLWRIWFEIGATQQYYPVVHTAFWILHRLAGSNTLAYHVVNIALHACSAWLLVAILRRLEVAGAALAGALFALHPVQVESVAWIAELKNVLSGVAYLLAALAWLRFDDTRNRRWYGLALGLFVAALLSKSVTATLPAGLLVVAWWRRGHLRWREDLLPLAPFVVLAAAAAVLTAWVERTFIGAAGEEFHLSIVERGLVAGRAIWFYLATLAWPVHLTFSYPKWRLDPRVWWQVLCPVGVGLLFALLWRLRRYSRAPLAAFAFFVVTLTPALGFVSVFPFRYSYVADHFQYLACIGPLALVAGGLARTASRWFSGRTLRAALSVALLAPLAAITWTQCSQYVDGDTLLAATLERNPSSWMAHVNLGMSLQKQGRVDEAMAHYRAAMAINPDSYEAHQDLALALETLGRHNEALKEAQTASRLQPAVPEVHEILGACYQSLGKLDDAVAEFREAIRLKPDYAAAHLNLGATLDVLGRTDEALPAYQESIRWDPAVADAHFRFGSALIRVNRVQEAITEFRRAAELDARSPEYHNNLAYALERAGQLDAALSEYAAALRLRPDSALIESNIGRLLVSMKRFDEARPHLDRARRLGGRTTDLRD